MLGFAKTALEAVYVAGFSDYLIVYHFHWFEKCIV